MTRKQRLFQATLMALIMSVVMSFFMAVLNVGFGERFCYAWMRGWLCSFLVAWPLSILLPFPIQWLIRRLGI